MKIVILSYPDDADLTGIKAGDKADIRVEPENGEPEGKIMAIINTASLAELLSQE